MVPSRAGGLVCIHIGVGDRVACWLLESTGQNRCAHESYIHTTLQLPVFMALKGQALTSTAVSSDASPFWVAVVKE